MNVLFALLAIQLVFSVNQIHFPINTGIPGVAPANFLLVAVLLAMVGKQDQVEIKPILRTSMLLFFGAMAVAFVWGQLADPRDPLADATYLKNAITFPAFYFIYLKSRMDEKRTRWLIILVMAVAAIAGLEAIREGIDYGIGNYNRFRRASGPFGVDWHDANRAGVFYGMFAPMFIAIALFMRGRVLWRITAIGGFLAVTGGALFTYSRQAYVLVLLAAALLLLRKNVIIAAVVAVSMSAGAGFLPESVYQRVEETHQQSDDGQEEVDASTASRWEIWEGAVRMWSENPMGVGLNHFKPRIGGYSKYKNMDAHNFYVLTLAETGPLGIASFLFLVWNLFRLARWLRKHTPADDPELNALTIGFGVCTFCMCMGGLYGSPTLEPAVMACYWALCGLLERMVHLKLASQQQTVVSRSVEPTLAERFPLAAAVNGPTRPAGFPGGV